MSISILKDPNLKFAIVAALNKQGYFVEEAVKIKRIKSYSREYNQAPFHWIIKEVYDYYVNVEIEDNFLNQITNFNPRGIEKCYGIILKEWDGEDDTFYISSLDGIECLTSMNTFEPEILSKNVDISALLNCSSLKFIKQKCIPKNDHTLEIISKLVGKGVQLV